MKSEEGNLSKTDEEHVNIFGKHFRKVFSRRDITFDPLALDGIKTRPTLTELDDTPTFIEMQNILNKMQNHKAAGPNNVPMDALKILSSQFSIVDQVKPEARPIFFLHELLCDIWEGSPVPDEWTSGTLCPIYKKGDATNPNNWRPVCLLDATYKVLAAIIAARINPMVCNDWLEEQCGCIMNKSCSDAVCSKRRT